MRNKKPRCPLCKKRMTYSEYWGIHMCFHSPALDNELYNLIMTEINNMLRPKSREIFMCSKCGNLATSSAIHGKKCISCHNTTIKSSTSAEDTDSFFFREKYYFLK